MQVAFQRNGREENLEEDLEDQEGNLEAPEKALSFGNIKRN